MLKKIDDCIEDTIKKQTSLSAAVVKFVNEDGTVDVYIPPNEATVYANSKPDPV